MLSARLEISARQTTQQVRAGVIALTKTIAKEGAHKNVRCNAIAPGFIQTEMTDVLSDSVKEAIFKQYSYEGTWQAGRHCKLSFILIR